LIVVAGHTFLLHMLAQTVQAAAQGHDQVCLITMLWLLRQWLKISLLVCSRGGHAVLLHMLVRRVKAAQQHGQVCYQHVL
jgi:hypothetical protein